ncbi:MAG: outer membrane beta-barrel protein [Ignavibacterium sp.]|nr:MAG: outer membrane beta-barrel protein [Ignavibacterium sp.]
MIKRISITLLFLISVPHLALAQNNESGNTYLKGRSGIDLNVGLYDNTSTTKIAIAPTVVTTNASTGFMGSISYQYWIEDYLSLRVGIGALVINANTAAGVTEVSTETATIVPILVGVNFYPIQMNKQSNFLPYISGYIGPYIGIYTSNVTGTTGVKSESIVENAFGARLGAGLDLLIGDIFKLGIGIAYHFITDFSKPIGSETNYSGPEYSISFGIVFN